MKATFFVVAMGAALVLAGCADDAPSEEAQDLVDEILEDDSAAETPEPEPEPETPEPEPETPEPEPEPEPQTPEPEPAPEMTMGDIQESFVGATAVPYSAEPIVDGEVKVYFNNGTSGMMVAIYHGAGLADPTGLCPGNSLFSNGGWDLVSNAPATEGACEGFTTEPGSVRVCTSNVWLYQTLIPNDSVGDLYGSLEILTAAGYEGLTAVATNMPATPEIDYNLDSFALSTMFTSDGADKIDCGPAMS